MSTVLRRLLLVSLLVLTACARTGDSEPTPDGDELPLGRYGCLLLSVDFSGLPSYVPSALGTIEIRAGQRYEALSFPGAGRYRYDDTSGRVNFRGGSLAGVEAAFRRLDDGTPILRFGEELADPAPEVEIGESVCQRGD